MSVDPRLADGVILALAAMRVRQQQRDAPRKTVTLRVVYHDCLGIEPDEEGPSYTYELPPQPGAHP